MRYEVRPQKHSDEYWYDGGFAIWDTLDNRQVGWYHSRERADARILERNKEDGPDKQDHSV